MEIVARESRIVPNGYKIVGGQLRLLRVDETNDDQDNWDEPKNAPGHGE